MLLQYTAPKLMQASFLSYTHAHACGNRYFTATLKSCAINDDKPTPKRVEQGIVDQGNIQQEIAAIALPTLGALAAQPLASLVDTAWVGRLGAAELAGIGVALSAYGTITKLLNVPLLSVTTSVIAESLGKEGSSGVERNFGVALLLGLVVGTGQAIVLSVTSSPLLAAWGAADGTAVQQYGLEFLELRALFAPATVMLLVLQGIFRGTGDAKVVLYATLVATFVNIVLDPIFIFGANLGTAGASAATGLSEAVAVGGLAYLLFQRYGVSVIPSAAAAGVPGTLRLLGPTVWLVLRTAALAGSFALATALVTRLDPAQAAGHQVCFQIWLASSLLADALAVSAQTLIAQKVAANNRAGAKTVVESTTWLSLGLGCLLSIALFLLQDRIPGLFTTDVAVVAQMQALLPIVIWTQPLNSLAFCLDGVLFGVQGFQYAAKGMVFAAVVVCSTMLYAVQHEPDGAMQLQWIWTCLALLMLLRTAVIFVPYILRMPPFDVLYDKGRTE